MRRPKLILEFKKPTCGYWDEGSRYGGEFFPTLLQDSKGFFVEWGCWELNFRFTVGFGRSWKHAATIGQKRLARLCRLPCSIKVEWEEDIPNEEN